MIRIRIRVSRRLARQYHHQAPSQRFNILYFGRDEFSCQVLEILYSATGMVPLTLGSLIKLELIRAARQTSGKISSSRLSRIK
jgi:hypothetical protein